MNTVDFPSSLKEQEFVSLKPGEPCSHSGCASHLSHPCEGCGRYAAGMANGPDVKAARRYIEKLGRDTPIIHHTLSLALKNNWTWEQTLSAMVIIFQKQNKV